MGKTKEIEITFEETKAIKKKLTVSEKELQALSGDGFGSETVKKLIDETMTCDAEDCEYTDYDYEVVDTEKNLVLIPFNR